MTVWSTPVEIGGVFSPQVPYGDPYFGWLRAPVVEGEDGPAYGTPEWWFDRLLRQIAARQAAVTLYEAYYVGVHRLTFATTKFREAFGGLFSAFADNWCQLVVDAAAERLEVVGFRFGEAEAADSDAWALWQANQLPAESSLAHTSSGTCGSAYVVVGPDPELGARIQVEHTLRAAVEYDPRDRRRTLAGVHLWLDPDGLHRAALYQPDSILWWKRAQDAEPDEPWVVDPEGTGPNTLGVVPIVQLTNAPSMWDRSSGEGRSDLEVMRRLQDAINKLTADMLVASEFAAFPQRWAAGLDVPKDPTTGLPLQTAQYEAALSRLMTTANPQASFGTFAAADLGNYVKAIESLIQHVAAQTRTPPHYLLGQSGAFPSGESLQATESGLVKKCKGKQRWFGEGWKAAMRLAFMAEGDDRRQVPEVIWADPASLSEAERVDALVKMASLGVPREVLWAKWGAGPTEVNRWRALAAGETLPQPAGGTTPPPPPVAGATPVPTQG